MADETPGAAGADSPADPEEASSSPAEKPVRRRTRAASAEASEGAAAEKPKRARAAAKSTDADASEETPKPRRTRAAAKKVEEEPVAGEAPKPRRARAKAVAEDAVTEEAPKPRRTRARAAKSEQATVEPAVVPPAPKSARAAAKSAAAKPTKPLLARRRRSQPPAGQAPLVHAKARYVRSSARKARIVCDHIRGKSVPEARAILAFAPRGVAKDWAKLLDSAVANAEHNHELIGDELRIKEVFADVGPTLKRFRPRAMGRATPINKRTAHLSITLTPKE
jgi:ribosomal protein L22